MSNKPTVRAIRDRYGYWKPSIIQNHRVLWWDYQEWATGVSAYDTKEEALQAARRWQEADQHQRVNINAEGEVYYGEDPEIEGQKP